ncbi:MAG: glycosyltransferase family 61 protein [Algoriphagus sp.]|nr:glycosyltransferase family 61 protein [Algoriphagus sp.]
MEVFEIKKEYTYVRELPVNILEYDLPRFLTIRQCNVSRGYIEYVNDAKVCQYYLFKGMHALEDFCLPIQLRGKHKVLKHFIKLQFFPLVKIEEAIWISDLWSKNYFHWILECLPRILASRKLGINSPLLLPEYIYFTPYIQESLNDLKIDTITFDFKKTVSVKSLYLPSHDSPCAFDPNYLWDLIQSFQNIDCLKFRPPFRKVYISRKNALKRKVSNEQELIPILEEEGFEVVQMEKLTFKQQRKLMSETKVLLSIHGAGLANLIFLPKQSKVVELLPDVDRYNSCFYHLASALRKEYYYSFEKADHPNPQEANIFVDLKKLKKILNTL